MFLDRPVRVPEVPGKIVDRKKGENTYVLYEKGRRYDKIRKFTLVDRCFIGVRIPARPEYMLPNENYIRLFPKEEEKMDENEKEMLVEFQEEREKGLMIRDFFEQIYYEFQFQSRRQPNTVLNGFKVQRLNRILEPLRDMMQAEPAGEYLELIPEPYEEETEEGKTVMVGMTYSDVMMILTQYRCAEGEYFIKMMRG
jgi:hypothetical protein